MADRLTADELAELTTAERWAYSLHGPDVADPPGDACCVGDYELWPCSLHRALRTVAALRQHITALLEVIKYGKLTWDCDEPECAVCEMYTKDIAAARDAIAAKGE